MKLWERLLEMTAAELDAEAAEAEGHLATDGQKKNGNYRKAHVNLHGLSIAIENARGSERAGVDRGGTPWTVVMPAHYGYIKRSEGHDGDHVDCYLGPDPECTTVYVINQVDADTGRWDEHKVMLGFPSETSATRAYDMAFSDRRGPERRHSVVTTDIDALRQWLDNGDTGRPFHG